MVKPEEGIRDEEVKYELLDVSSHHSEEMNKLRACFDYVDSGQSGRVSRAELQECLRDLLPLDEAESKVREILDYSEHEEDCDLTYSEFVTYAGPELVKQMETKGLGWQLTPGSTRPSPPRPSPPAMRLI